MLRRFSSLSLSFLSNSSFCSLDLFFRSLPLLTLLSLCLSLLLSCTLSLSLCLSCSFLRSLPLCISFFTCLSSPLPLCLYFLSPLASLSSSFSSSTSLVISRYPSLYFSTHSHSLTFCLLMPRPPWLWLQIHRELRQGCAGCKHWGTYQSRGLKKQGRNHSKGYLYGSCLMSAAGMVATCSKTGTQPFKTLFQTFTFAWCGCLIRHINLFPLSRPRQRLILTAFCRQSAARRS